VAFSVPPVLVLACRRPELTARLLQLLVSCGCRDPYVVVDGPDSAKNNDAHRVERTREAVRSFKLPSGNVWLRDANVGGPHGVPKAIDWFFAKTDRGIILMDDLAPSPSFFAFAAELLEKYESDARIAAIHGWTCRLRPPEDSYYFSRYAPGWGWATWASRWKDFDREGQLWFEIDHESVLRKAACGDPLFVRYWSRILREVYVNRRMNWDYRWVFTNFALGRLTATAGVNLVDHFGFGSDASHYRTKPFYQLPVCEIGLPLRHPPAVAVDHQADRQEHYAAFLGLPWIRLRYGIASIARGLKATAVG